MKRFAFRVGESMLAALSLLVVLETINVGAGLIAQWKDR